MSDESNRPSPADNELDEEATGPPKESEDLESQSAARWMTRTFRLGIRIGLMVLVLLAIFVWIVYWSAQHAPEFYHATIGPRAAAEGDEFEKRFLDLQNAARAEPQWQALFTDVQINGWLATDFPNKFPNALPNYVSDPRVGLVENGLQIAFRYDAPRIKAIIHAEADVFCTEVPGQFAVRIKKVRSGFIPIAVASIADRITEMMRRLELGVTWTEIEGDPTALIDVPPDRLKLGDKRIEFESIQLLETKLLLSGRSVATEN